MSETQPRNEAQRNQRWMLAGVLLVAVAVMLWWLRRSGGSRKLMASLERTMARLRGA